MASCRRLIPHGARGRKEARKKRNYACDSPSMRGKLDNYILYLLMKQRMRCPLPYHGILSVQFGSAWLKARSDKASTVRI